MTLKRQTAAERRLEERRSVCLPLSEFPPNKQAQIEREVAQPYPPEKWMPLGPGPRPIAWITNRSWWEWHWQRGIDPEERRPPIPTVIRDAVIARDGNVCQLCGGTVQEGDRHLDHIVPWSKGGKHAADNLQVTHSRCNMRKAAHIL